MSDIVTTLQEKVKEVISEVAVLEEEIGTIAGGGYVPAGSVYFADLPALSDSRYGFVYNIKDEFTTTSDFVEGAGKTYSAGTNVGIVKNESQQLKYDVFSAFVNTGAIYDAIDTKQNINLSQTIAGATTVEGALAAIASGGASVTVDTEMSITSENPVQNKVITAALNDKLDSDGKAASATSADFATKATNDGADNNIANTYLTKTDAASTYLGINAKAASATTADSATSATTDGNGNNIVNTYETKSDAANRELGNIADVNISNPTNGQVLKYDANDDEWKNAADTGGSTVSVTQIKSSGEKIATITVDGADTDLYASSGGGGGGAVDSVNGQTGDVVLDATDVGALPDNTSIPSKTSDLTNDSGFIANTVNNLINYYLKTETYTKNEVDALISVISSISFEVVSALPTTNIKTNVIYLVPKTEPLFSNVKDEYINLDGTTSGWELIGSTAIDLSGYVTDSDLATALADYTNTADLTTLLAGKQNTISDLSTIRSGASAGATAIQPSSTSGLVKNDGSIDTNTYITSASVSGKADKVVSATNGNFAGLDSNGNLTDSGSKASDFLTSHQDITGKADKVSGATNGNFAGLDSNGNLTDSGSKASDFVTPSDLTNYIQKSQTIGLVKNDGTIDTNTYVVDSYLEQTVTLSTSADTTITFSDARFTTNSVIDIGVSEWGLVPKSVTCTTGVCTVVFGSVDSAQSITCRVYVR